jgi:ribosomal protein S18 acetylase RimI-like enzyme
MSITIRPAKQEDTALLSKLSIDTFKESYAEMNDAGDMNLYINEHFMPHDIQNEIEDGRNTLLLAMLGDAPAGYVKLSVRTQPAELIGTSNIQIERLYVLKQYQEQKIGANLMSYCMSYAIKNGFDVLWLAVWVHNEKAIAFYERWGFEVFGKQIFQLGRDAQDDLLMKRKC